MSVGDWAALNDVVIDAWQLGFAPGNRALKRPLTARFKGQITITMRFLLGGAHFSPSAVGIHHTDTVAHIVKLLPGAELNVRVPPSESIR